MKYVLGVLVDNHPGVLSKVSGLFSRRGFNIDSLAVGETENPEVSRITIVVDGDEYIVDQLTKQLNKLINVIKVSVIGEDSISRELALIKVRATPVTRNQIVDIVNIFRAKVVDVNRDSIIVEITGDSKKIAALEDMLKDFGILELVRTGTISIDRGMKMVKYIRPNKEEGLYYGENVL
ncbi:MAG: acetolactate synthase small subunit [Caldicoprobacterales bacterium]|jgi:acetolactate synthase-1/3 small subunit|nr:acetolactate synthase small subunit [Clostridiales bacterium]